MPRVFPRARFRSWIWAGLLVASALPAFAEDPSPSLFARVWRSHEGLPGNEVTGMAQDGSGYLWVACLNSLARFDGIRFQTVPLPLPEDHEFRIRFLLRTAGDRFWLALDGGTVLCLSPDTTNVLTTVDGLPNARPSALVESRDGAVWIGYSDSSVCRIEGQRVTRYTARDGLAGTGNCRLATDTDGRLWFAQTGRVGVWREGQFHTLLSLPEQHIRIQRARAGGIWICADLRVLSYREGGAVVEHTWLQPERGAATPELLLEDRTGTLWIGTYGGGVFRYHGQDPVPVETSQRTIFSLFEDREGNIWVGTAGGGLNRLRPRVLELQHVETGLPFESARSLCVDGDGRIWAAARNGTLARLEHGTWRVCTTHEGWSGEMATCVTSDREGAVWIGTYRAGALYRWHQGKFTRWDRQSGLAGSIVRMLLADRAGHLWVGLASPNGLQRLKDGQLQRLDQFPARQVPRAAVEDTAGNVWVATLEGHLFRVEGDQLIDESRRILWPPQPISGLHAAPDGSLWIGYARAGLGRLRHGRFDHVGPEHGFPSARICSLASDTRGGFWFATDQGVLRVSADALEAVADGRAPRVNAIYHGSDELLSLEGMFGYWPGATRNPSGDLLFPVLTGLAVVYPDQVSTNRHPPQVIIESVTANDQPVVLPRGGGPVRLQPGLRKLEFQFTAPSFIAPASIRFRHQLEGVDEDWVELGTQRGVTYTRLSPGRYRFRVTACNHAGLWNEVGDQVAFEVRPFLWQRTAFQLTCLAALALGVASLVRFLSTRRLRRDLRRLEQETALHRERARIAKDIHDDLGASLTQISLLGELAHRNLHTTDKLGEHVRKLSLTARQAFVSLDEIVWAVNPGNDTLASLLDYLAQFALDFLAPTPIRCRLNFPVQPPRRTVSAEARHTLYLVVKEALNNAVKHAHATEIQLHATLATGMLRLTIQDNGVGFDPSCHKPEGDGLRNMRRRVVEVGGSFQIGSQAGSGTRITVAIPLAEVHGSNLHA